MIPLLFLSLLLSGSLKTQQTIRFSGLFLASGVRPLATFLICPKSGGKLAKIGIHYSSH